MTIKKYIKYVDAISHNITSIKADIENLFIDRITGTNEHGEEELIENIGSYVNGSLSVIYNSSYRILNIYYDDASGSINDGIISSTTIISSSFSKYKKIGRIELDQVLIETIMNIKPVVTYDNIGDAHISAVYNITLYDENDTAIHGYEIYAPISSDSVLYTKEMNGRYSSRYGYIDDKKITDSSLLIDRNDVFIFAIPINNDDHIKYSNGIISIHDINASSLSISGTIHVVNTDFTKISHTPLIKNISLVIYS